MGIELLNDDEIDSRIYDDYLDIPEYSQRIYVEKCEITGTVMIDGTLAVL